MRTIKNTKKNWNKANGNTKLWGISHIWLWFWLFVCVLFLSQNVIVLFLIQCVRLYLFVCVCVCLRFMYAAAADTHTLMYIIKCIRKYFTSLISRKYEIHSPMDSTHWMAKSSMVAACGFWSHQKLFHSIKWDGERKKQIENYIHTHVVYHMYWFGVKEFWEWMWMSDLHQNCNRNQWDGNIWGDASNKQINQPKRRRRLYTLFMRAYLVV